MKAVTPEARLVETVMDIKRRFAAEIDLAILEYRAARPPKRSEPGEAALVDPRDGRRHLVGKSAAGGKVCRMKRRAE